MTWRRGRRTALWSPLPPPISVWFLGIEIRWPVLQGEHLYPLSPLAAPSQPFLELQRTKPPLNEIMYKGSPPTHIKSRFGPFLRTSGSGHPSDVIRIRVPEWPTLSCSLNPASSGDLSGKAVLPSQNFLKMSLLAQMNHFVDSGPVGVKCPASYMRRGGTHVG